MKELIVVKDLKKSFSTPAGELNILKGIDATFFEGEVVSIVGASGVGKSTFLHIIGTLDKPTYGNITYKIKSKNGKEGEEVIDPFSLSNGELATFRNRVIGFVFQFHYLLPEFSAQENVMMPGLVGMGNKDKRFKPSDYKEIKERAERLLDELGIYKRKDHKPGELSGGEQQRVAVARALLLEPKIVFADEPTGNLDTRTGEDLFKLLMNINQKQGISFIIVTHNESLSRKCHRTMEMVDGKLY